MEKSKSKKSAELFEVMGLSALCLFVTYLLINEVRVNKKCIPDFTSQEKGRCL